MSRPSSWRAFGRASAALALAFLIPVACSSSSGDTPGGAKPDASAGDGSANGDGGDGGVTFPPPPHGFALVKDIDTRSGASNPSSFVSDGAGGPIYFSADDGVHGPELWKTDLSSGGTALFFDTVVGSGSGFPSPIAVLGSRVVYTRLDPVNADTYSLWSSDGTEDGTTKLGDVEPVGTGVVIGGGYYFCAQPNRSTGSSAITLWTTDGTPGGTKSLGPTMQPQPVVAMGGNVFFIGPLANDGNAVFRYEPGSGTTTALTAAIGADALAASSTKLFFYGNSESGLEPWVSDGTPGNTAPTGDINSGPSTSLVAAPSTVFYEDAFYFVANDGIHGAEVWKTDGTGANTVLVADVWAGISSSNPTGLTAGANGVYFAADDGVHGIETWFTDGTPGGTHLVKDIGPASTEEPGPTGFIAFGRSVVFRADDGVHGSELWKSDGTEAGTAMIAELVPGVGGSTDGTLELRVFGDKVVYACSDATTDGELCVSDGTAGGTHVFADIRRGTADGVLYASPGAPGRVALLAYDSALPQTHLWTSDGTADGTTAASTTLNAVVGSGGFRPAAIGTSMLFWGSDAEHGDELWKTDGTGAGTILLKDIQPGPPSGLGRGSMRAVGDIAYFAANDGTRGLELWKTDGTADGTTPVSAVNPGGVGLLAPSFASGVSANALFFGGFDSGGPGVFRADASGITKLAGGQPRAFAVSGTRTFWITDVPAGPAPTACELWTSDPANTGNLSTLPGPCDEIVPGAPGTAVISIQSVSGRDLWTSDGTGDGTRMLHAFDSVAPLPQSSVWMNGALYFAGSAADAPTGLELWKTDQTVAGTVLVKDIQPGALGSDPRAFVVFGSAAYFTAEDGTTGAELWSTDGTAAGTILRGDLEPGLGGSSATPVAVIGSKLYFTAKEGAYGKELWSFDPAP